ncbi:DMT family transporter [Pseudothioclava nitratireducens]|jgi:drug/metabolite transporter (DMT)-like permease|uniref:DMT family transporter n=1 Tax=Pseudothioclava nitratireducens TaxID=1928646 RepID=UPI0023DC430F|nr:DMT family transporter [Defluviimonas nitratireducens]MDF1620819.1 DMT family transporter [Defluviimonas nitratireducens]
MAEQDTRKGIWLMVAVTFIFAMQDGISRHIAGEYNVFMALMVRFWFFAGFVIVLAARAPGGLKKATRSAQPLVQIVRSVIMIVEVIVMVQAFVLLGLVETHAVFASYPLIVAVLSGPILGEKVGWRRAIAIAIGFVGVLIILEPGFGVFSAKALVPLAAAFLFALYSLLTRYVGRKDPASVSFFYTGVVGAIVVTAIGLPYWEPLAPADWGWMAVLCLTASTAHFLLIKAYEVAEASAIQPFAYLQLVWAAGLGMIVFDEVLEPNVAIGAGVVAAAGIFTILRTGRKRRS